MPHEKHTTDGATREEADGSAIRVQRVAVGRLQPAPYNPRIPLKPGTAGYRKLERSLSEFGLVEPIVWNERTGHVVSGHQRLEILKHQGATEIDVAVVSLPLEREKTLNVALNNREVGSDWDADKLVALVSELAELPDIDATLTGFDEKELRDLVLAPEPAAPEPEPDEPDEKTVTVRLEVPTDDWENVRPALDEFLTRFRLKVHIDVPE